MYTAYSIRVDLIRTQVIVNEETAHETQDFIRKRLSALKSQRSTGDQEDLALVIGTIYRHSSAP